MSGAKRRRLLGDRGQAFVEFAIVSPILIALLYGMFQFAIVFKDWIALTDGMRAAARAEAVCRFPNNPTPHDAFVSAASDLSGDPASLAPTPACGNSGDVVAVTLSQQYTYNISIPFIGTVLPITLSPTINERIE